MFQRFFSFIFLSIFFCFTTKAQQTLTLQQAIEIGLQNSWGIQLVKADLETATINNTFENAGYYPLVSLNATETFTRNDIRQRTANGNELNQPGVVGNNLNLNVLASWTFFNGFRLKTTKARLEELQKLGEVSVQNQVQNTIAAISSAYVEVVRQQQQLRAVDQLILINEDRLRIAENKWKIGTSSKQDYLQAQIDLNILKSNRLRQNNTIQDAKIALNQVMARPATVNFEVEPTIELEYDVKALGFEEKVLKNNFELKQLASNIKIAEINLLETKALRRPTAGINLQYGITRINSNGGFFLLNQNLGLNVSVFASIPLYDGGFYRRTNQTSQIILRNQQILMEQLKIQLDQSYQTALQEYFTSLEIVKLEEESSKLAQENVQIAQERFQANQSASSLELKEAQTSFESTQIRLIDARYNAKLAEIELRRLNGDMLEQ